jgi:hypothetical protein
MMTRDSMENNPLIVIQEIGKFQEEFSEVATNCQKFCFATRAREFQIQACGQLQIIEGKANDLKKRAIACEHEDAANLMLSYEQTISALANELNMWISLKDDDPGAAWDYLVNAQTATRLAMQAHQLASHLENYDEHLAILEKHLFPQQLFCSPGMVIKEARCSICSVEYGECDHIAGKPYMGQICSRLIVDIDLEEISIVDKPANKQARIVSFTDDEGVFRDFLSWREVPSHTAKIPEEE